ncbi:MAG: hypothetical protein ABJB12_07870 [Pseudomonadota bacterium]
MNSRNATRRAARTFASALPGLLLGAACEPPSANLGGSFRCPTGAAASCWFFDSGLKQSAELSRAAFDAAQDSDPAAAPRIAYPLDQTTEPPNLYELDIQWHRSRRVQTLFRIRVESSSLPYGRYDIYAPCLPVYDGCHYSVPESEWFNHVVMPLLGSEARLTVAGSDAKGGPISVSGPVQLRFSQGPVPGGLYYWSARAPNAAPDSPDQGTTYRLAIGARRATPFIRSNQENPKRCEGCHAVSANGDRIAFTASDGLDDGPQAGSFIARSTTTPSRPFGPTPVENDSAMIALNQDGSLALIGRDNRLFLRVVESGAETQIDPALLGSEANDQGHGYFPEFSRDQKHIVVTLSNHPDSPWSVTTGSIATLDFDASTRRFSKANVLVPMTEQEFHYYPSWSPDNEWIVFASAPRGLELERCSDANDPKTCPPRRSYDQPESRLRLVHFPDGRVYDLNRATQHVGSTSTLPKFAPLPSSGQGQLSITFNSKMNYGVRLPNSPAQLWLSVLDFDRLPDDPSSAPVWLPFQGFGQKNHMAYWTDKVPCRTDVDPEFECGLYEYCAQGECLPVAVVK